MIKIELCWSMLVGSKLAMARHCNSFNQVLNLNLVKGKTNIRNALHFCNLTCLESDESKCNEFLNTGNFNRKKIELRESKRLGLNQ